MISRFYDPLQSALQNLAAIISTRTNIERMNEILECPVQSGSDTLTNDGCDIVFDHVGFEYNSGDAVLRDVSFTAKQGEITALVGPRAVYKRQAGKYTLAVYAQNGCACGYVRYAHKRHKQPCHAAQALCPTQQHRRGQSRDYQPYGQRKTVAHFHAQRRTKRRERGTYLSGLHRAAHAEGR